MICAYVGSLLLVLSVSLAFNMAPVAPIKLLLAHFDQAAIFLLIAGTQTRYSPCSAIRQPASSC